MSPHEYEEYVSRHNSATTFDAKWQPSESPRPGPPRPPNPFMLWRSWLFRNVYPNIPLELRPKSLPAAVSRLWKSLSKAEALRWSREGVHEKEKHAIKYPNYKYHPTQKAKRDKGGEQQGKKAKRQKSRRQKSKRPKHPDVVNTPQNDATPLPTSFPDISVSYGPVHRSESPRLGHWDSGLTCTPQRPYAASQSQGNSYNTHETLYHGSSSNPFPEESTSQRIQTPTQTHSVPLGSPSFFFEQSTRGRLTVPALFEPHPQYFPSIQNMLTNWNRSSSKFEPYDSSTFEEHRNDLTDQSCGCVPFVRRDQQSESSCYVPIIKEQYPEVRSPERGYIPHAEGLSYNGYTSTTPSDSYWNLRPVGELMSPASDSRRELHSAGATIGTTDYDTNFLPEEGAAVPSCAVPAMNLSPTWASESPSVYGMDPMDPTSTWAPKSPSVYGMDPMDPTSTWASRLPSLYDMGPTPIQTSHLNSVPSSFTPQYELPPTPRVDVNQTQQNHLGETWRPVDVNAYQSQDLSPHATTKPSTYIKASTPPDGSWPADIPPFPEQDLYNSRRVPKSRLQAAESVDPPDVNRTNSPLPLHSSGSSIPETEEIDLSDWIHRLLSSDTPPPSPSSQRFHPYKRKSNAKNARRR